MVSPTLVQPLPSPLNTRYLTAPGVLFQLTSTPPYTTLADFSTGVSSSVTSVVLQLSFALPSLLLLRELPAYCKVIPELFTRMPYPVQPDTVLNAILLAIPDEVSRIPLILQFLTVLEEIFFAVAEDT